MNKVKNTIRKAFTIIPNELINDNRMSDRARFLFCYMASKPDDWEFYHEPLAEALGYSVDTLRKYLKELMVFHWVSRSERRIDGKFNSYDYDLHPSPCGKKTDTVKNRNGKKPERENSVLYNKDYNKERLLTKKDDDKGDNEASQTEKWATQLKADQMFMETAMIVHKVKPEKMEGLLSCFLMTKRALEEDTWKDYSDFRKNFLFWLPKNKAYNPATPPDKDAPPKYTPPPTSASARQAPPDNGQYDLSALEDYLKNFGASKTSAR